MVNRAYGELKIFSGTSHPDLGKKICNYLDIKTGKAEIFKFSNDNTFVRILDNLMELLIFIDAAKRASAGRISAVIPYFPYGRTDK